MRLNICWNILKSEKNIQPATRFTSKHIASNAIKENLRNNVKEIVSFLKSGYLKPKSFDYVHKYPIGNGILKGKTGLLIKLESCDWY